MRLRPRRLGCLGSLVALLVIGALAYLGPVAIFAPWGFFLGGHFHVLPMWQAWGRIHSPTEGDYLLYVQMAPTPGTRGFAAVSGLAEVCSPRGVISRLTLGGNMERHMWADTEGKRIHLYLHRRDWFNYAFNTDRRPRLDLYGAWHNPVLELDDRGSLSEAFNRDGSVNMGRQASPRWTSHLALREGTHSAFAAACRADGALAARQ